MNITTTLNEVDFDAVGSLIEAITTDEATAETTWTATTRWTGGFRTESTSRGFKPTPSDEPAGLGGTDTATNPVEQLLAAFGSCLAVGYAANATAAGATIEELSIELTGELDLHSFLGLREGHAGFSEINAVVNLVLGGSDVSTAEIHDRVIATSPVGHTLSRAIPVSVDLSTEVAS